MGIIFTESVEELISQNESIEKNNKQQEYLNYIKTHVYFVQKAFSLYFLPLLDKELISNKISDEELKDAIKRVSITIVDHDASKYSDDEFDGYREKYYPTANELADSNFQKHVEERAEQAWVSHYKHNWHHPKYWIDEDTGEIKDMNLDSIIEMICDWSSFSLKEDNPLEVLEWYKNKAEHEKASMSDRTREIVEELLFNVIHR